MRSCEAGFRSAGEWSPVTIDGQGDADAIPGLQDVAPVVAVPKAMSDAWNRGDAESFTEGFAVDAVFVAFEGTVLHSRQAIIDFHQPLFDTVLKGSTLSPAEIVFARLLAPDWAIVHNRVSVTLPGEARPSPSRNSMQLFVLRLTAEGWHVQCVQNSRIIDLARQQLLDDVAGLAADDHHVITTLAARLARPEGGA